MKPNIVDVLTVLMMKDEASRLYEEIDNRIAEMKEQFGTGRFDYALDGVDDGSVVKFASGLLEKGAYLKFEIEDVVARLQAGENVFKSTAVKPVTFSSRSLKRCPDSLK